MYRLGRIIPMRRLNSAKQRFFRGNRSGEASIASGQQARIPPVRGDRAIDLWTGFEQVGRNQLIEKGDAQIQPGRSGSAQAW